MLLFMLSLLNPLLAEEKYTEIKKGDTAPYDGVLLTKQAIAKIYTDHKAEIKKIKVEHDYNLNLKKLKAESQYDLLDKQYKLDIKMYEGMITSRDEAIKKLPVYSQGYKSDWSMIGGFILGSVITVGIVYSIDKITIE